MADKMLKNAKLMDSQKSVNTGLLDAVIDGVHKAGDGFIKINGTVYPVIDGVIIMLPEEQWTPYVRSRLQEAGFKKMPSDRPSDGSIAYEIQESFGAEWQTYNEVISDHDDEFEQYFDLVDLEALSDLTVLDAGCGSGRWSYMAEPYVGSLVCVDFSDAIFVAKKNLAHSKKTLFLMADVKRLPFKKKSFDLIFSIGVLHHIPAPALETVKELSEYSDALLIYLYYSFDNRPTHYKAIFKVADLARRLVSRVRYQPFRKAFAASIAICVYRPFVYAGNILNLFGKGTLVPLWQFYRTKTLKRTKQDVFDRFFTSIEQRFSKKEIIDTLEKTFDRVIVSDLEPYWHFISMNRRSRLWNKK